MENEMGAGAGAVAAAAGMAGTILIVELAIALIMIVSLWKIFSKAGQPGWAALIPFYNAYVLLKIADKPGWWLVLMLIPGVNLVIMIITMVALAANLGKGGGFLVGLILLTIVFCPILGFGGAQYKQQPPVQA